MLKYPDLLLPSVTFNAIYQAFTQDTCPLEEGWVSRVLALLSSCSQVSSERFIASLQSTLCVLVV